MEAGGTKLKAGSSEGIEFRKLAVRRRCS